MKTFKSWIALSVILLSNTALAQDRPSPPDNPGGQPPSFSKMDTNGDSVVTCDEADGPIRDHFTEIDTNGDGKITEQEFTNHTPPGPPPSAQ
ncbi:EF-hand domain-containing protein [Vibrio sp. AK197]